jgi:ubiquinone biosynthesis monooxygenase Coq7
MSHTSPQPANSRQYSALDRLLGHVDQALRTLAAAPHADRPSPAAKLPDAELSSTERDEAKRLMRVNYAGEVAAQALYHGQAFVARSPTTEQRLLQAAREEGDHLAWCAERIHELGGRTSYLNPLWYAGSFAIGALAGLAGDRTSLGFVAETERQVEQHLDSHLERLPPEDQRSRRAIRRRRRTAGNRPAAHASDRTGHDEYVTLGVSLIPQVHLAAHHR